MSVFRRKRTNRKGKAVADKIYTVEFRDHMDVVRRVSAFTDKAASLELERNLKRLVSLRLAGSEPDADLSQFLDVCPVEIRERLGEWNIISGQRAAAGKSIAHFIEAWREYLQGHCSEEHAREAPRRVGLLFSACRINFLSEVTAAKVEAELLRRRRENGTSIRTSNLWLSSAKSFLNWLKSRGRLSENPLATLKPGNDATDRRLERHPYSVEELGLLLAACEDGESHHGLTGHERAMVYRLAVDTGFRYSEIRSLTRASFDFTGDRATVMLLAADAKNEQDAKQPLREDLTSDLRAHLSHHLPLARAFRLWGGKGAAMIRQDLEAAGILARDENGELVTIDEYGLSYDFHGLRHTFATMLNKAKVPLATAQRLMRHSDPKLTAKIYTHVMVDTKAEAIDMLPTIAATDNKKQENIKTGTDDQPLVESAKNADRPGDSRGSDSMDKITTYSDNATNGKRLVLTLPETKKAPVSQGETGPLRFGAGEALLYCQ